MANKFNLATPFRHVKGSVLKRDLCFCDLSVAPQQLDSSMIKANSRFFVVNWAGGAGGSLWVAPHTKRGKFDRKQALIQAHRSLVTDFDWNPFDDWMLATGDDGGEVKVWKIPDGGLTQDLSDAYRVLSGHQKRASGIAWHPTVSGVLATCSYDKSIIIWDVEAGKQLYKINNAHDDAVYSIAWSFKGDMLVSVGKDKKVKVWDPRTQTALKTADGHLGNKPSCVTWLGDCTRFITTGFSKTSDREYCVWDTTDMSAPYSRTMLDCSTGILLPLFMYGPNLLVLAGKGDVTIRVFETCEAKPGLRDLTNVMDKVALRGACLVPTQALEHMSCEVTRLLRVAKDSVDVISFDVPKKTHIDYHPDIYPPTLDGVAALTLEQYVSGTVAAPALVEVAPNKFKLSLHRDGTAPPVAKAPATTTGASASVPAPVETPASPSTPSAAASPATPLSPEPKELSAVAKKAQSMVKTCPVRHVSGKVMHRDTHYDHMTTSGTNVAESNFIAASAKFVAVPWHGNGGCINVIPIAHTGRQEVTPFMITGHTTPVCALEFAPWDDCVLATGCEDGHVRVWRIPEGGLIRNMVAGDAYFDAGACNQSVRCLAWHPWAKNVLASGSLDGTVHIWDVENSDIICKAEGLDQIQCLFFDYLGKRLGILSKDKKLRLMNPRTGDITLTLETHLGLKVQRGLFVSQDRLITVGFSRDSQREFKLWDLPSQKCLKTISIDQSPGILMPFYDPGTKLLFLAGKGDGNIRMFEITDDITVCATFASNDPQVGMAALPKSVVDVKEVEVMRLMKILKTDMHPISFKIPRTRMEYFQDDLFPPVPVQEALLSVSEWMEGQDPNPQYVSMQPTGMAPLSLAPPEEKTTKNPGRDAQNAQNEVASREQVLDAFHAKMNEYKGDFVVDGQDKEGADEDEWDD